MVFEDIHKERVRIANEIQPDMNGYLDCLNQTIENFPSISSPYEGIDDIIFMHLCNSCKDFKNGAQNNSFNIKAKHPKYLFRYQKINPIIHNRNFKPKINCKKPYTKDSIYNDISDKCLDKKWLKLSVLQEGYFSNNRGFSWWTSQKIDNIDNLFTLGLVSDWLEESSIIMRIECTDYIKQKIKLPSVIDGYLEPIFYPSILGSVSGKTINLNILDKLENGFNEYLINEIPTDLIEIRPFFVDVKSKIILMDKIKKELFKIYKNN